MRGIAHFSYRLSADIRFNSNIVPRKDSYREAADDYLAYIAKRAHKLHMRQMRRRAYNNISIERLVEKYNGICQLCFNPVVEPTRDHIKPLARGGNSNVDNLQLACSPCNVAKGDKEL